MVLHILYSLLSHSVICLTTGPYPLPKRILQTVRSSVSSLNFQYPVVFLTSPSICLRILPRLPVTYIPSPTFPSIMWFIRQFLRKMWPIQLLFLLFIVCRIFLFSLTLCNPASFLTRSIQLIFSKLPQHHISKLSRYFWSTLPVSTFLQHTMQCSKCTPSLVSSLNLSSICWLNYVHGIKSTQQFWQLLVPLTVTFPLAARDTAHNNECGPLP